MERSINKVLARAVSKSGKRIWTTIFFDRTRGV